MRARSHLVLALLLPAVASCNEIELKPALSLQAPTRPPREVEVALTLNGALDVLFVIDDTAGMGVPQQRLARAMGAFVDALAREMPGVDVHFGFTTTDNGNPICGETVATERGALVPTPCTARLGAFTSPQSGVAHPELCTDVCPYAPEQLDARIGTDSAAPPWIDAAALPEDIDLATALACMVPQGLDGCGFESPLESMFQALVRADDFGDANFGFTRRHAPLVVVVLTNELDCSHQPPYEDIFAPDGERVFWSDPQASWPTSAVCWNAGTQCTGGPGEYDDCAPANRALDGELHPWEHRAVLYPTARYSDLLQGLEISQESSSPPPEVWLAVIAGVPPGYPEIPIPFADPASPERALEFGIAPGCVELEPRAVVDDVLAPVEATPPVRLRAVTQEHEHSMMYSICSDSYAPVLEDLAVRVGAQFPRPTCYLGCATDTDADAPGLQPRCDVIGQAPEGESHAVPECVRTGAGHPTPPAGAPSCYVARTQTDRPEYCVDMGSPLAFEIVESTATPPARGTQYTASCVLSRLPDLECPDLPRGDR